MQLVRRLHYGQRTHPIVGTHAARERRIAPDRSVTWRGCCSVTFMVSHAAVFFRYTRYLVA